MTFDDSASEDTASDSIDSELVDSDSTLPEVANSGAAGTVVIPATVGTAADARGADPDSFLRGHWRGIIVTLFLALAVRAVCLGRVSLVGADTQRFIQQAQRLHSGDYRNALGDPYHPLTAVGIASSYALLESVAPFSIGNSNGIDAGASEPASVAQQRRIRWEYAAHLFLLPVSLIVVLAAMLVSCRCVPRLSIYWVGGMAAMQPYWVRASVDIMSDMLFLALFSLAVGVGCRKPLRWRDAMGTGALTGLAYLARPEAVILGVALPLFWWLEARSRRRSVVASALFGGAALSFMFPYVLALKQVFGVWTLTAKKGIDLADSLAVAASTPARGAPDGAAISGIELVGKSLWHGVQQWFAAGPELITALFAVAVMATLWKQRGPHYTGAPLVTRRATRLLLSALIPTLWVLIGLSWVTQNPQYASRRHLFSWVFLTLPMAAVGALWMAEGGACFMRRWNAVRWRAILAMLLVLVLIPKAIDSQRERQLAQKQLGEWILHNYGSGEQIFSYREKIPYYACGHWRNIAYEVSEQQFWQSVAHEPRAFVAFYSSETEVDPIPLHIADSGLALRKVGEWVEPEARHRKLELWVWEERATPIPATVPMSGG